MVKLYTLDIVYTKILKILVYTVLKYCFPLYHKLILIFEIEPPSQKMTACESRHNTFNGIEHFNISTIQDDGYKSIKMRHKRKTIIWLDHFNFTFVKQTKKKKNDDIVL